jgi:hypothetical protein
VKLQITHILPLVWISSRSRLRRRG